MLCDAMDSNTKPITPRRTHPPSNPARSKQENQSHGRNRIAFKDSFENRSQRTSLTRTPDRIGATVLIFVRNPARATAGLIALTPTRIIFSGLKEQPVVVAADEWRTCRPRANHDCRSQRNVARWYRGKEQSLPTLPAHDESWMLFHAHCDLANVSGAPADTQ